MNTLKIHSVYDKEFSDYGEVVEGIDTAEICGVLKTLPCTNTVCYVMSEPVLENLDSMKIFENNIFGGMPVQLGWCNGHNTKLNCLEYHRDSEFNLSCDDFILLLGKLSDIKNDYLDTSTVKAFKCPAGVLINVYATTLHFAPCSAKAGEGFRVLVALPKGTNGEVPQISIKNKEDKLLRACNKWLLAHPDSAQAKDGATVALTGPNIDIADLI